MGKVWIANNADYVRALQTARPPGVIWTRDPSRRFVRLLQGIADELVRVHGRANQLIEEADPQTTTEMLADWERVCALPEFNFVPPDMAGRRRVLTAKLRTAGAGGQSETYFEELAAAHGFTWDVYDGPWTFYFTVQGAQMHRMRCNDPCNSPLVTWTADAYVAACSFTKNKPAHAAIYWTD